MPTVRHSRKADSVPTLTMTKPEREILANALGLCVALHNATVGYCPELAEEANEASKQLERLANIESLDLTTPW